MKGWRKLALQAAGLLVVGLNVDALLVQHINPAPPAVEQAPIRAAELRADGPTQRLEDCWWTNHRGQHVLYVEGDPYTLGFCNARLADTDRVLDHQEAALTDALDTFVPYKLVQFALIRTLAVLYRGLPDHLLTSDKLEIRGISEGREDRWTHLGPTFGRVLYYHALHDISQAMIDNPVLAACTAFAATGTATVDGHTLLARNFDFEAGRVFDEHKVIVFARPDVGLPFVSVVWGGMAGAVSGMNAARLGVVLNAAGSDRLDTEGRPTTLVLRSILQFATSVEEAIRIVRAADILVADVFTVADGKTGELAVIEMAPGKVEVRRGGPTILATNHFLTPGFSGDEENAKRMRTGTTVHRYRRLAERVRGRTAPLDPAGAVSILRDRKRSGGRAAGLGHRGTIDALIAAHAVVFDLTDGKLWVSSSPHTLGAFVAYDLEDVLARGAVQDLGALPADPLLASGAYDRYERAKALVERSKRASDDEATALLQEALRLAPGHPPAVMRLAEACEATGQLDCARTQYQAFLELEPPYETSAVRARERLRALADAQSSLHQR